MYLLVRCKLVTTPWSGVICRASHTPPLRHAVSTMYRCLKCDRYVVACGLRYDDFLLAARSRLWVRRPSAPTFDGPTSRCSLASTSSVLGARSSFCHHDLGSASSMSSPELSSSTRSSFGSALKENFWHSSRHALSSLTSSRHFLETCEARARVVGSSTHSRI